MHTGERNPLQLPEDEQNEKLSSQLISGKRIHNQKKLMFPALNSSNNSATIDYEALINTKQITPSIMFLKQCQLLKSTFFILFVKSKELIF